MADSADPLPQVAGTGGYGSQYPRRGHYFRNVAIAAVALVASCLVIHPLLPFPDIPEVTPKLRYFVEHKDEFDTLFVGSSHIYREVIPETFDRAAAAHGVRTRSFNLAIGGMQPPESFYFLDQVLRAKPANLKWVFVELQELQPKWPKEKRETRRFLYWHNWHLTRLAVAKAINPERRRSWWEILWLGVRSKTVRTHVGMLIKNFANVGAAKDFLDWGAIEKRDATSNKKFDERRGYEPHPNRLSPEQAAKYLEQLQRWMARAHQRPVDAITDEAYRDCARTIHEIGARPIFLLPPNPEQVELRFRDADSEPGPVLVFNQAARYPELYEPRVRTDVQHLTPEGAEMFTRLLAERFATELASTK